MLEGRRKIVAEKVATGSAFLQAVLEAGFDKTVSMAVADALSKDKEILEFVSKVKAEKQKWNNTLEHNEKFNSPVEDKSDEKDEKKMIGETKFDDPKLFLRAQMNNPMLDDRLRFDAAKTLLPLYHGKVADMGKKVAKDQAAKEASKGKFSAGAAPAVRGNLKAVK